MTRRGCVLAVGVMALLRPPVVRGSERSEMLDARAQAAYQAHRFEEARGLFADAVAADGEDATALYGLGLALGKLGRWEEAEAAFERALRVNPDLTEARRALGAVAYRRAQAALDRGERDVAAGLFARAAELAPALGERAREGLARAEGRAGPPEAEQAPAAATPKRWGLRLATGVQYDSNIALEPQDSGGDEGDVGFLFAAGGYFDLVQRPRFVFRLIYDFYQTLNLDQTDFNFRSNSVAALVTGALRPWLWAGLQGGYNNYALGGGGYLQEPFALPYFTIAEGQRGLTQFYYRYGGADYLDDLFDPIRSGPTNAAGFDHRVLLGSEERYLTFGYQFEADRPRTSAGNDYDRNSNQLHAGVAWPVGWATAVELLYLYEHYNYTKPNSEVDFRKTRTDNESRFYAGATRDLTEHLRVHLAYHGTIDNSNIGVFDYRRSVVSLLFELVY